MTKTPRLLFFLEGRRVPASRFRVLQYCRLLKHAGIEYRLLFTWPSKYYAFPASWRGRLLGKLAAGCELVVIACQRLIQILAFARRYDVIVLQRDLLFRFPYSWLERHLKLSVRRKPVRLVMDVDDAIFLDSLTSRSKSYEKKAAAIASQCDLVICGNRYLEEFYRQYTSTCLIPTVIDTARYPEKKIKSRGDIISIGWTGVRTNLPYLSSLDDALAQLQDSGLDFEVLIICDAGAASPFSRRIKRVRLLPWRAESEIDDLLQIDIGLMPLPDDPWTRGKCGSKLLQYMAAGIPAVASPVGVNCEIVKNGETGFLAASPQEWGQYLGQLITSPQLRAQLGGAARRYVGRNYSLESWFPAWISWISHGNPG